MLWNVLPGTGGETADDESYVAIPDEVWRRSSGGGSGGGGGVGGGGGTHTWDINNENV